MLEAAVMVRAGLLFLSRMSNEAGKGMDGLISGIYLGGIENHILLAGGFGICFYLPRF